MKSKRILIPSLLLTLSLAGINAQSIALSAGGDATGTGGSLAYSIGQAVFSNYEGESGTMNIGVQQPYVVIMVGTDEPDISLSTTLYPNPVSNSVNLRIDKSNSVNELKDYSLSLFDTNGKMILHKEINSTITSIPMAYLPEAMYILYVMHNNAEIKTFKIFKTN